MSWVTVGSESLSSCSPAASNHSRTHQTDLGAAASQSPSPLSARDRFAGSICDARARLWSGLVNDAPDLRGESRDVLGDRLPEHVDIGLPVLMDQEVPHVGRCSEFVKIGR